MTWERDGRKTFFKEASDAQYEKAAAGPQAPQASATPRPYGTLASKDYQDFERSRTPTFWDSIVGPSPEGGDLTDRLSVSKVPDSVPLIGGTEFSPEVAGAALAPLALTGAGRAATALAPHVAPGVGKGLGMGLGSILRGGGAAAGLGLLGKGLVEMGKATPGAVRDIAEESAKAAPDIAAAGFRGALGGFKGLGSAFMSDVAKPAWGAGKDFASGARSGLEGAYQDLMNSTRETAPGASPASKPSASAVSHTQAQRPSVKRIKPTTQMAQFRTE